MRKPPVAWPMIDPISQVAELMEEASRNSSLGTTCEIMEEKVGPEKERMAPVPAITMQINAAMVQWWRCAAVKLAESNKSKQIQAT